MADHCVCTYLEHGTFTTSVLLRPHEVVAGDYRRDQRDHESCSYERVHVGLPLDKSPNLDWDNNLVIVVAIAALVDANLALEARKFLQTHQLGFRAALPAARKQKVLLKGIIGVFRRPSRHPRIYRLRHATPIAATVRRSGL